MTTIEIRGTTAPDAIAVVLALLARAPEPLPRRGILDWQARRRAALKRAAC